MNAVRRWRSRAGWGGAAALVAAMAGAAPAPPAAVPSVSVALLSGAPDSDADEPMVAQMLREAAGQADLVLHLGNLKGESERCDDEVLERRRALLEGSALPLVLVPGDNDWTDCDRDEAGRYAPVERLARLRELLFDPPRALGGGEVLALHSQGRTARYRPYTENVRWTQGAAVFATFNMPGSRNNFRTGAGRNGEYEERVLANVWWLQQAFGTAARQRARMLVLAFHADPGFGEAAGGVPDPYADFKSALGRLAATAAFPVLLVHAGESLGGVTPDRPVRWQGRTLAHVLRVRVPAASASQEWLLLNVGAGRKPALDVARRYMVRMPPGAP